MRWWFGPVIGVSLLVGIAFASCNVTPTQSPISPVGTPLPIETPTPEVLRSQDVSNLLVNAGFEGGHYQPKGETSMVLPLAWKVWALDEKGVLKLYDPAGMRVIGQYRDVQYGLRPGQDSYVLKPEVLHITFLEPYLDPPRIFEGLGSLTGFKLYGHLVWWAGETVATIPGHLYEVGGSAHAWSRMSEDKNDAHCSHAVGCDAFYGREDDTTIVNEDNDNYRFTFCADPFGAENPLGSAVLCGTGSIIYNVFHAVEPFTFTARADSSTIYLRTDTRFGMLNSNAYWDSISLVDITAPPTETPTPTLIPTETSTATPTGTPRPTYTPGPSPTPVPVTWTLPCVLTMTQRVFVLLPPGSSAEWYTAAISVVARLGWSIGTSGVDSCLNSCGGRVTLAVNAEQWGCNLAKTCTPACGAQGYVPLSAETPEDLALALERYPAWLHEAKAWGLCLPTVMRP